MDAHPRGRHGRRPCQAPDLRLRRLSLGKAAVWAVYRTITLATGLAPTMTGLSTISVRTWTEVRVPAGPAASEYIDGSAAWRGSDDAQHRERRSSRSGPSFDGRHSHCGEVDCSDGKPLAPAGCRVTPEGNKIYWSCLLVGMVILATDGERLLQR